MEVIFMYICSMGLFNAKTKIVHRFLFFSTQKTCVFSELFLIITMEKAKETHSINR